MDGLRIAIHYAGRLTNIVSPADSTTIGFTYDNANRPETRTFPNGVTTTYTFDRMSRLKRLKDTSQTVTLFDRQYEYNNANQIESVTEPGRVRNFSYDFVNRLTGMTSPTEPAESYDFDKVGIAICDFGILDFGLDVQTQNPNSEFPNRKSALLPSCRSARASTTNSGCRPEAMSGISSPTIWDRPTR
ncbi:MAG: hypothetical protein IPK58_24585 [Acidobacteria bacterium]|nr:hypothetical protein [Acidobacteriota bacterium]